jgi:hypothetical protein
MPGRLILAARISVPGETMRVRLPYDVGMTGLLGFASGYRAMEHCDALLMLGTDFPYREFYPENTKVVQVDTRGEHIGRRVPVDVGLLGTIKDTGPALLALLKNGRDATHLARMRSHYRRTRERLDALADTHSDRGPIHPQTVAKAIDRLAGEDAVFLPDVGSPVVWASRYLSMNGRRRLIGSFNHGTMANAMPQAIGVQASHPGREVVTLSGDGGLAMMMGDLLTHRQQHLPVKVVVFNNGALAFVELEMKAVQRDLRRARPRDLRRLHDLRLQPPAPHRHGERGPDRRQHLPRHLQRLSAVARAVQRQPRVTRLAKEQVSPVAGGVTPIRRSPKTGGEQDRRNAERSGHVTLCSVSTCCARKRAL